VSDLGKILIGFGVLMVVVGGVLVLAGSLFGKVPWLGRLPGDIHVQRGNWSFYFPLATSVLVSIVLSLLLWLLGRR
jgi:tellurite resistance protein TehA-like permease